MKNIFESTKIVAITGDLECGGRGYKRGKHDNYAIFRIVNIVCDLEEDAVSSILEFCEEAEQGDVAAIQALTGSDFTIEHHGDATELTLHFVRFDGIYEAWKDDLTIIAREMKEQIQKAAKEFYDREAASQCLDEGCHSHH